VNVKAWTPEQPSADSCRLVRAVVIHDQVDIWSGPQF
jgi:hypothetical protein